MYTKRLVYLISKSQILFVFFLKKAIIFLQFKLIQAYLTGHQTDTQLNPKMYLGII